MAEEEKKAKEEAEAELARKGKRTWSRPGHHIQEGRGLQEAAVLPAFLEELRKMDAEAR